ncbi:MAG: hypothetical protein ACREPJ_02825, partial [Rhodanobacteraceae bacterium]
MGAAASAWHLINARSKQFDVAVAFHPPAKLAPPIRRRRVASSQHDSRRATRSRSGLVEALRHVLVDLGGSPFERL